MNLRHTVAQALWLAALALPGLVQAKPVVPALAPLTPVNRLATQLDNDGRTDWVRAYRCHGPDGRLYHCLRIALSKAHTTQRIRIRTSASTLRITSHDVDGDHRPDLLVVNADNGTPLGIWLNDGHGRFKEGDASIYPSSIWHDDPLISAVATDDDNSPEALDDIQESCLDSVSIPDPLFDAATPITFVEPHQAHAARQLGHAGRAPPAL